MADFMEQPSAMFDYISGKKQGTEAQLTASLEHALGLLGAEIEDNRRLRAAMQKIIDESENRFACREIARAALEK